MEKYAVVLEPEVEKEKTASTVKACRGCARALEKDARWCPNCGTEPWEQKPEPNEK